MATIQNTLTSEKIEIYKKLIGKASQKHASLLLKLQLECLPGMHEQFVVATVDDELFDDINALPVHTLIAEDGAFKVQVDSLTPYKFNTIEDATNVIKNLRLSSKAYRYKIFTLQEFYKSHAIIAKEVYDSAIDCLCQDLTI
jgi:hypothetical protein